MNKHIYYVFSFIAFISFRILISLEKPIVDSIFKSIGFSWILWYIFDSFAWKLLPSKCRQPCISGRWVGKLKSSYEDGTEKEITLTIKQRFSSCKVYIETNEINSETIASGYWYKEGLQYYLLYSYNTKPKKSINDKNPMQYGTTKIRMEKDVIYGEYWTNRRTIGNFVLKKDEKN